MRGFVDDHRCNPFDTRSGIGNEALVQYTGFERMVVMGKGVRQQVYPNPVKTADDAGVVDRAVLLYKEQCAFQAYQVGGRIPITTDPNPIDMSTRGQRELYLVPVAAH